MDRTLLQLICLLKPTSLTFNCAHGQEREEAGKRELGLRTPPPKAGDPGFKTSTPEVALVAKGGS